MTPEACIPLDNAGELLRGNSCMESLAWNLVRMECIAWKLLHGTSCMELLVWNLFHGTSFACQLACRPRAAEIGYTLSLL